MEGSMTSLQSPMLSRERIMVYGPEGGGKSSDILSVARACPDNWFYYIDNDNTMLRLLETDFTDVAENGNVVWEEYQVYDWDDNRAAIEEIQGRMGRDDWLVIDMTSKLWDMVQEWFIEQIFQEDIDDYFLKVRMEKEGLKTKGKDAKSLGAFEGWLDWPVINQTYHKRVSKPLLKTPGHLFCVAESKKIEADDDKGIKELYGPIGVKPGGQKRSGHIMQTVLFQNVDRRQGTFKLETVKDRGRELWKGEGFGDEEGRNNFAEVYLQMTAGWGWVE